MKPTNAEGAAIYDPNESNHEAQKAVDQKGVGLLFERLVCIEL
jgi:hypothetical protein